MTDEWIWWGRNITQFLLLILWIFSYFYLARYSHKTNDKLLAALKWMSLAVGLELAASLLVLPLNLNYSDYRAFWIDIYSVARVIVSIIGIGIISSVLVSVRQMDVLGAINASGETLLVRLQRERDLTVRLKRYLNVISHDLQTPLRTVIGYIDLIKEDHEQEFDEDLKEELSYIEQSAWYMSEMIDGLLNYTRLINKKDSELVTPINLFNVVDKIIQAKNHELKEVGATIECRISPDLKVIGNEAGLETVFRNLIGNAIKFRGNRPLVIKIRAVKSPDGVRVSVEDNGIGIKSDYQYKVFDIYQRLNPNIKGLGLGLALCQEIIDQHGSKLLLNSEYGIGSEFYFVLKNV